MEHKYESLTAALREAANRGQDTVDMDFDQVAALVDGLPPSATSRQWWANSSHSQALAWRAAGFHVSMVSLDRRRVRFTAGQVGGSHHDVNHLLSDSGNSDASGSSDAAKVGPAMPIGNPVDVRVVLEWMDAGNVVLDGSGKPKFASLPSVPGIYRLTMTEAPEQVRPRVYIGESDNLARRLGRNYRNPGSGQQTSLRVNARLREHLGLGGSVALVIATSGIVHVTGGQSVKEPIVLDLSRKASRLLAENAALVLAHLTDDADIENLP